MMIMTNRELLLINNFLRGFKSEYLSNDEIEGQVDTLFNIDKEVSRIQEIVNKIRDTKGPEAAQEYALSIEPKVSEIEIKPFLNDSPKHFKGRNGEEILIIKKYLIK